MKKAWTHAPHHEPFVLAVLLGLALFLRITNAAVSSLKLDDFHSIFHSGAADLGTFFAFLVRDNHPPLSFLLLRGVRALLGDGEWALRTPSMLAGLGTILLLWRLGRRLDLRTRIASMLLLVASSLHVEISSDLRMYSLLALSCAGLLDGMVDLLEEGKGRWRVALWTVIGLHCHYHFLYAFVLLALGACLLVRREEHYRPRGPALVTSLLLGLVPCVPWYVLGFATQLRHGLAPGGSQTGLLRLVEGFMHLVFLNLSAAWPELRPLWLLAAALLVVLAVVGALALHAAARPGHRQALFVLSALLALGAPTLACLSASLTPRAGFEWRYLAGALVPFCLLAGAAADGPGPLLELRRIAVAFVATCAVLFAGWNAMDHGGENYEGAVARILDECAPGDAVVAADWQPYLFPHALAWNYYAARLAGGRPLPERLEFNDTYSLANPTAAAGRKRVFCCLRSLPAQCGILRTLRRLYPKEETEAFGVSVFVHVFSR